MMVESDDSVRGFIEESIQVLEEQGRDVLLDAQALEQPISVLPLRPVVVVEPELFILDTVALMVEQGVGCVLVVRSGRLTGIFTERDVLTRVVAAGADPAKLTVRRVMTPAPEVLRVTDSVAYALNKMSVGGYRHVPLVDETGAPVAVVSVKDIVKYLVSFFPDRIVNLPPDPRADVTREREGA